MRAAAPGRAMLARREGWRLSIAIVVDGDVAQPFQVTCHPGPEDLSPYISVGWSYVTGARMRRLHIVCAPRLSFVQRAWAALVRVDGRSEERRVGKEGGGRGWRSHEREEEDGWGRWVG